MDSEIYVSCHAPSLSLLLYETVRSVHSQKGLLIGEICKEIVSGKTDENEMNIQQKTTVYLEHCIPIKDNDVFGRIGNVNKEKLQKYIDEYNGRIVGWYSFRRNTKVNIRTLHEILIHKSLIQSVHGIVPEYFVAAFMSASVTHSFSTHIYNHIFMRYHPVKYVFEPLRFKIYTMTDKIINVNGYSIRNSFPVSKNFENIINPIKEESSPVKSVLAINKAINKYLKLINKNIQDVEKNKSDLEQQIKNLRKRLSYDKPQDIKIKELEKQPKLLGMSYLQFDTNIKYNPNRRECPIKDIFLPASPEVPEEQQDMELKTDVFDRKINSKKSHPGIMTILRNDIVTLSDHQTSDSFSSPDSNLVTGSSDQEKFPKDCLSNNQASNSELKEKNSLGNK